MTVRISIWFAFLFGCCAAITSFASDTSAAVKVDFSVVFDDGEQWSPTLIVKSGDTGELLIKKAASDGTMAFYKIIVSAKADAQEDAQGATLLVQLERTLPTGVMRTLYTAERYLRFGTSVTDDGMNLSSDTATQTTVSYFVSKINDPAKVRDSSGTPLSGERTSS
ncbi:MAG: hypothetical protein K0U79_05115 [Gammaproteobacteria bacterium]|nr:hypothetical protein [Gammaproteobacteria bacterium]